MKTTFVAAAVVAAAGFGSVALGDGKVTVNADPGGSGGRYNGSYGPGGGFEITWNAGYHASQLKAGFVGQLGGLGLTNSFYSFCVERNEYLDSPQWAEIRTSAAGGGVSGQDGFDGPGGSASDSLDARTALLYQEFRNDGNFGGVGNIGTLAVNAARDLTSALQIAIWHLEGEVTGSTDGGLVLFSGNATAVALVAWAQAQFDAGVRADDVRVLRLWDSYNPTTGVYGGTGQDVLTIIPLPPAAWAGLGTLGCVLGFSAIRRRRLANA